MRIGLFIPCSFKEYTLGHGDRYLEELETKANEVQVHWAKDAAEHNRTVHGILGDHGAKSLIKSKSLTEEGGFRPYRAAGAVAVIETDLGERIQQSDTAVVMVVAAMSRNDTRQQPLLRLFETVVGIALGVICKWIGSSLFFLGERLHERNS